MSAKIIRNLNAGTLRELTIEKILSLQDPFYRWGFDEKSALLRPEYNYYSPNFKATLWTLILLADLKAPANLSQARPALDLVTEHFFDPEHGVFRLPGMSHFPIPCLNGNMIFLLSCFNQPRANELNSAIEFFAEYQRFDDGDFKTPSVYPYCSNRSCYGKHTCYWGVTKLFKGLSFIPKNKRSKKAKQLIKQCIDFVLLHEVCFSSRHRNRLLNPNIGKLTLPNFYNSDLLEILWLLKREGIRDKRMDRALVLLRSKMKEDGSWELERSMNIITSIGQKGRANPFIAERANEVLNHFGP